MAFNQRNLLKNKAKPVKLHTQRLDAGMWGRDKL